MTLRVVIVDDHTAIRLGFSCMWNDVSGSATEVGLKPACLLQSGVVGYLTKSAKLDEIMHAIRRIVLGHRYVAAGVAHSMVLQSVEQLVENPFVSLSGREMQVAIQLMGKCRIKDIARLGLAQQHGVTV